MSAVISREYQAWRQIRYKDLGLCTGWQDYQSFLTDMGRVPKGFRLERIDARFGLTCGKCAECIEKRFPRNARWSALAMRIEFQGAVRTVTEWAELLGISRKALERRLEKQREDPDAWPWERVLADKGHSPTS